MANCTVKDAQIVHGTNPQYLIEKIIRSRIYDSRYWKEECFALSAELLVDKAMDIKYVGGVYGANTMPSPFLCLILKMLQIQPEKRIVIEFIRQEDFKYVRVLGALYMRIVGSSLDCYHYLEPLLNDYRKLKKQTQEGTFEIIHVDEFIDTLLKEERVCDIVLPRIQKRQILEEISQLVPRVSALDDESEQGDSDENCCGKNVGDQVKYHKGETVKSSHPTSQHRYHYLANKKDYSHNRKSLDQDEERHRHHSRVRERSHRKSYDKSHRHRSRSKSPNRKTYSKKSSRHTKHSHR